MKRFLETFLSLPITLAAGALVLFLPLFLRVLIGNPLIPGAAAYSYLTAPGMYGALLRLLVLLGDARVFLSALCGLVTLLLVAILVRQVRDVRQRSLLVLLTIINPFFIGLFTTLNPYTLIIPLGLLTILFRESQRGLWSVVTIAFLALLSPLSAFLLILLLQQLGMKREIIILSTLIVALLVLGFSVREEGLFPLAADLGIAEFGSQIGISLLFLILALLEGLLQILGTEKRWALLALLVFAFAAAWSQTALVFLVVLSTPLAALFTRRLLLRRWAIAHARSLTLLLVFCSFLFVLIAQINLVAHAEPKRELVLALAALPPDENVIFAPLGLEPVVEHLSARPAYPECPRGRHCLPPETLLHPKTLVEAERVLQEHNITYLLISREMRDGGLWWRDEEGLLFYLQYSDRFSWLSHSDDYWLVRYVPQ